MAKKVFISIAAKTRARPRAAPMTRLLPKANLFFDVSTIGGGEDFVQRIESEIDRSDVALIFIGDKWLEPVPGDGKSRIFEPDDYLRAELQTALGDPCSSCRFWSPCTHAEAGAIT